MSGVSGRGLIFRFDLLGLTIFKFGVQGSERGVEIGSYAAGARGSDSVGIRALFGVRGRVLRVETLGERMEGEGN